MGHTTLSYPARIIHRTRPHPSAQRGVLNGEGASETTAPKCTKVFSHTMYAPSVSREIVGEALLGMWHVERIAPRGSQRDIVGVIGERKQERDAVDPHIALLLVVPASPRGPGAHVGSSTAAIHGRAVDGPRPAASGKRASEAGGRDAWTRRRCARKTSLCLREVASIENSRRRSDSNMTWV